MGRDPGATEGELEEIAIFIQGVRGLFEVVMMFEVDNVECPTEDRRWENKMQDGSTWVPIGRRCLIISEEG